MTQSQGREGVTDRPLVAVEGITVLFPGVVALADVDFSIRAGEVHALTGETGSSNVEAAINKGVAAITSWTLDPKQCGPGNPQQVSAEKIDDLKPGAKTIVVGLEVAESTKEITDCFVREAEKAGLDVINKTNNEADNASGSQKVFEPLLTKYPDVEAVWNYNDESALGVSAALLAGGKTIATTDSPDEGVIVTGSNGDQGAIEAVEEGRISWTWDPDNLASGFAAVKLSNEAVEGGKPSDLIVESILVDGETIAEYVPAEEREYTLDNIPVKPVKGEVELAE